MFCNQGARLQHAADGVARLQLGQAAAQRGRHAVRLIRDGRLDGHVHLVRALQRVIDVAKVLRACTAHIAHRSGTGRLLLVRAL